MWVGLIVDLSKEVGYDSFALDGTDADGTWKTFAGEQINFHFWADDGVEPSTTDGDDCRQWNKDAIYAVPCSTRNYVPCEKSPRNVNSQNDPAPNSEKSPEIDSAMSPEIDSTKSPATDSAENNQQGDKLLKNF